MNLSSILGNTRRHDISMFSNGRIDITSGIANALGIREGDVIDIMHGDGEFYIYVAVTASSTSCGRHQARCYPSKRGARHFRAYSRRLCAAMLQECRCSKRVDLAAGATVCINGHTAMHLITRRPISSL